MAKGAGKKNGSRNDKAAVVAATSSPMATTTSTEDAMLEGTPAAAAARPAPRPAVSAGRSPVERQRPAPPGVEWVGEVGAASLRSVQMVLPTARTPVILLGAGLLVAGVVELPVVVGAGLVYEALRRWQPRPPRVDR